jgi:hypothetical protein
MFDYKKYLLISLFCRLINRLNLCEFAAAKINDNIYLSLYYKFQSEYKSHLQKRTSCFVFSTIQSLHKNFL